jgi:glycine cleavage system regulatory protein
MQTSLVVTIIGDDRPGIVEEVSDLILAAGGNWEESRMARLAGKFAGLLRVSVDAEHAEALASRLTMLDEGGLTVVAERSGGTAPAARRTFALDLVGSDHPGIIRDISRVLAQHGVNIEELETEVTSAPMSGETLFRARARLGLPPTVTSEDIRRILEAIAADLLVDLTFEEDGNPGIQLG